MLCLAVWLVDSWKKSCYFSCCSSFSVSQSLSYPQLFSPSYPVLFCTEYLLWAPPQQGLLRPQGRPLRCYQHSQPPRDEQWRAETGAVFTLLHSFRWYTEQIPHERCQKNISCPWYSHYHWSGSNQLQRREGDPGSVLVLTPDNGYWSWCRLDSRKYILCGIAGPREMRFMHNSEQFCNHFWSDPDFSNKKNAVRMLTEVASCDSILLFSDPAGTGYKGRLLIFTSAKTEGRFYSRASSIIDL